MSAPVAAPAAPAKVWNEIAPTGGAFVFLPGERYAVLASISKSQALSSVTDYATGKGFAVTYAWEQGTATRGQYPIDDWLASLPPDTRDNHRWLYAEGDYNGAQPLSVGQDAPWPLTLYHVARVYQAVDAPAGAITSTTWSAPCECPRPGCPWWLTVAGVVVGVGGGYWLGMARRTASADEPSPGATGSS